MSDAFGAGEGRITDELLAELADEFLRRHRAGLHPERGTNGKSSLRPI